MENILLTILLLVTIALVLTILLQRSEGGALGIGGSQGGMMSARGAADFLSRSTKWLAIVFLATALGLNWLAARKRDELGGALDILDAAQQAEQAAPATDSTEPEPDVPTIPDDDAE